MPGQKTPGDGKASLQQAVESLARQVVLNEGGGWDEPELSARQSEEIAASLREISASAAESGGSEVAGIAAELLKAEASGEQLAEGMRRLQEALATPTQETAEASGSPAAVASLGEDPELLADFVLESREHLANIEN